MTRVAAAAARSPLGEVTLQLAHSYTETQPQHRCGAQVIADEVAAADVGVTVEIFPTSQLGADADRIASVISGDIDIDIQGASALGAVYEPVSVLDAAYAFDDSDHLARFFDSDASTDLLQGFEDETGVHTLGAWSAGMREFTANEPIREPGDLDGLRMRFPNSPQFLMNAEAWEPTPPRSPTRSCSWRFSRARSTARRTRSPTSRRAASRTCRTTSACPTTRPTATW